jgi:UDP-glucose 4-epimerase
MHARDTTRAVLVTGGAGFIGSHLCELLLAGGDRVCVVDNLSTGRSANLAGVRGHPGLRVVEGDCASELAALARAGEEFDEVYHLAAAVGVRLVVERPIECIETNVLLTAEVLRFALRCGPGGASARVLIASSSEVYGKSAKVPFAEDDDVTYGPTSKARWSYAASKAIDEYLALAHHQQSGLGAVVVRFFNTVGPRQVGDYGMVLPSFVRAALAGETLLVYGDGEQTRCFCDVRDVVGVLPCLVRTPGCAGRVFNVGADRGISIRALAELVIATLGSSSRVESVPYEVAYSRGFEDLRQRQPDLTRLRAAVGFSPRFTLERTILDLAQQMGPGAGKGGSASVVGALSGGDSTAVPEKTP